MIKIGIINYGAGNLFSVKLGLERIKAKAVIITPNNNSLEKFDALVLPGVGAFGPSMQKLDPIVEQLKDVILDGKPLLGICLGLQLLFSKSCEGTETHGLDIIKGNVIELNNKVKLPQIGWNTIKITKDNPLLDGIPDNSYFYFVHSYIANPKKKEVIISETNYGGIFPSIIARKNIFATQFHPEKSGEIGKTMLENFISIVRR